MRLFIVKVNGVCQWREDMVKKKRCPTGRKSRPKERDLTQERQTRKGLFYHYGCKGPKGGGNEGRASRKGKGNEKPLTQGEGGASGRPKASRGVEKKKRRRSGFGHEGRNGLGQGRHSKGPEKKARRMGGRREARLVIDRQNSMREGGKFSDTPGQDGGPYNG